jgi:hypothetical protein
MREKYQTSISKEEFFNQKYNSSVSRKSFGGEQMASSVNPENLNSSGKIKLSKDEVKKILEQIQSLQNKFLYFT